MQGKRGSESYVSEVECSNFLKVELPVFLVFFPYNKFKYLHKYCIGICRPMWGKVNMRKSIADEIRTKINIEIILEDTIKSE